MKSRWQTEYLEAFRTPEELGAFLEVSLPKLEYNLFIPKSFARKIKQSGPHSPLWKQFVPHENESHDSGLLDPIGDHNYQVTRSLIHRYKNRALFLPTTNCPVHCRYCFRKNELQDDAYFGPDLKSTLEYLNEHAEIQEIIFTGGDPLILSNQKIRDYLTLFASIKHIQFIRFHTRTPIILPERIDQEFCQIMNEFNHHFKQITLMIHCNHTCEIDSDVESAFMRLNQTSLLLFSQTVLLNDINDSVPALSNLFLKLSTHKIIPYYLHHPDHAKGTLHFQKSLSEGRKIYAMLRRELPGWMIPQYIIDIPGGKGKTPAFNPESYEFTGKLINQFGELTAIND